MIRIVGLSATLPNYRDVAHFLGVNADTGERGLCAAVHFAACLWAWPLPLAKREEEIAGRRGGIRQTMPCASPRRPLLLRRQLSARAAGNAGGLLPVSALWQKYLLAALWSPFPVLPPKRSPALPLPSLQFVGVSERNLLARNGIMDDVCYQKVLLWLNLRPGCWLTNDELQPCPAAALHVPASTCRLSRSAGR